MKKVYKEGKIVRGKEYNIINKKVIFEGEYKNGKRWEGTLNEYSKGVFDKKYKLVNYKDKTLHILLDEKKVKKEFDGNGFIREYKNNKLIFEGEYKNWKRFKGKEFKNKELIFEGEYNDEKRYKGREYWEYKFGKNIIDIIFKGEYKNGIKWKGEIIELIKISLREKKFKYENGKKVLESQTPQGSDLKNEEKEKNEFMLLKNDEYDKLKERTVKENNKIKFYNKIDELIFCGDYTNGIKYKGFEREFGRFGETYFIGYFQENKKFNGTEFDKNALTLFEGEFKDNKKYKGKEFNKEGELIFEGIYNNEEEKWNGKGYCKNKEFIFVDGKIEGNVITYDYINHELFEGEYKNGEKYNGILRIYFDDINHILKKEIEIKNGKLTGKGKEYYGNKRLKYVGNYVDGKFSGNGTLYYEYSGYINYIGEFKEGLMHGEGKKFDKIGNLIYQGQFSNGQKSKR